MKTGLVLEGGAMRGLFSAGVLDTLLAAEIPFDGAVGVSAGAAFGCNYKSRQNGRVLRYNTRFCADPRYHSLRSLLITGDLYGADFCYRRLPEELDPPARQPYGKGPEKAPPRLPNGRGRSHRSPPSALGFPCRKITTRQKTSGYFCV